MAFGSPARQRGDGGTVRGVSGGRVAPRVGVARAGLHSGLTVHLCVRFNAGVYHCWSRGSRQAVIHGRYITAQGVVGPDRKGRGRSLMASIWQRENK